MYQVCFDEYPEETTNGRYDPFYVAGYMHLFCLEQMIPMAEIMTFADVQADVRDFPLEQRNPMSLNRDGVGHSLLGAYNEWKFAHYDRYVYSRLSIPKLPRKSSDCLYKFLTVKKMESQPGTRQKMRDQRNGFDISKHCGNLLKLVSHKADARKKRKRDRHGSDDSSAGADSDAQIIDVPATKRHRTEAQASPRRSRHLSKAMAAQQIDVLLPAQAMPASYVMPMPFDTGNAGSLAAPVDRPHNVHGPSQDLNVQPDQSTMAALNAIDFSYLDPNLAGDAFSDAYNIVMLQYQQAEPQIDQPPLPYYGTNPQSPYQLRDTHARRETAIRRLSARASQLNSNLVDPQLLQLPLDHSPVQPSLWCMSKDARSPSASLPRVATPGFATVEELDTPTRRVTRSMSRAAHTATVMAYQPQLVVSSSQDAPAAVPPATADVNPDVLPWEEPLDADLLGGMTEEEFQTFLNNYNNWDLPDDSSSNN